MEEKVEKERIDFTQGYIVVAPVDSTAEESPLLTEEDHAHLATLHSPTRRAQWSTWRCILREMLGAEAKIRYNSMGAPVLEGTIGEVGFISVSHSSEMVAVMFSATRCGVDIECCERNFERVASRYINHDERESLAASVGEDFEALMWSAKEAIYKYGNTPGVDFTHDVLIVGHSTEGQRLHAELYGMATPDVHYRTVGNQILCYLCQ